MSVDTKGVFAGFVIAPALGAAVCVFAMMIHFVMTDPAGADLPLGDLMPLAGAIWFSALMFAYPAAVVFTVLWLPLRSAAVWIGGPVLGFAAMGVYLHRIHGGSIANALAGGRDISALTLGEAASAFALPLIGAGAGLVAALIFAVFARR